MRCHDLSHDTLILEIGCGEGGNLLPFVKLCCEVLDVDISKNRIREARQRGHERQTIVRSGGDIHRA